jgi:uncharacterized protein with HEPN domain
MKDRMGDEPRLLHILDAIAEIQSYTKDLDASGFQMNSMLRFASIKQLEIIGEASRHLSDALKIKFPDIEWEQIIGLRNILIHEYFGVDSDLIWQILDKDIPLLKSKIEMILTTLK